MTMQQLNIGVDGKHGDGDQSMLSGNDAQILRNQWSDGMDYNPLENDQLSALVR